MAVAQSEVERAFSRRIGAQRTRIVRCGGTRELLDKLGLTGVTPVESLGGVPVTVPDMRELAGGYRARGEVLVVDNTTASSFGSAPGRRGGHVVFERLAHVLDDPECALVAVSVSRDARSIPGLLDRLDLLPGASEEEQRTVAEALPGFDERRRRANDLAQVVATFLSCHPGVGELRYPDLPTDPGHEVAASLLFDGFGPLVDLVPSVGARGMHQACERVGGMASLALPSREGVKAWLRLDLREWDGGDVRGALLALESALSVLDG